MPYVKRISIKTTMINSLRYITDNKKTTNKSEEDYFINALNYIAGKHKVHDIYGLNCSSNTELAYNQMQLVKKQFSKENNVQGYHYIQSFKPGEVTPELSMQIGKEFAEKVFKGHQVLITTHIDKSHIHNHFIVNSVNFETGKKLDSSTRTLYMARDISDDISRKYNLNIIQENKMRKNYKSSFIQHDRKDKYDKVRKDIDILIKKSDSYSDFKLKLMKLGYKIKEGKYLSITPIGYTQGVRTNKLGQSYSKDFLIHRIDNKELNYSSYLTPDLIEQLKKLTRSQKNEKLNSFTEQINFINRYKITSLNDLKITKENLESDVKNTEKSFFKASVAEAEFKKVLADVYFLKKSENKSLLSKDDISRKSNIENEFRLNRIDFNNLDMLLKKLNNSLDNISIQVMEYKSCLINQKEDLKILYKLIKENEKEKNIEQKEK